MIEMPVFFLNFEKNCCMKTLIIVRHAKSDWGNLMQPDFDRELSLRGLRDAPVMGKRLFQKNIPVDQIISSTAKRAAQTAQLIAAEIIYSEADIKWVKELYHAPPHIITEQIFEIDNKVNTAMIVCHNPGITSFVNGQCGNLTDNVPTCAMVAFTVDTDKWEDFSSAKKKLLFYDFPKKDH